MQTYLETSNGVRTPFNMTDCDKIRLDQLLKSGKVYHVIRTDRVEVLRLKLKG